MSQETTTVQATRTGITKTTRHVRECETTAVADVGREGATISLYVGPGSRSPMDGYRIALSASEAAHLGHLLLDLSREIA